MSLKDSFDKIFTEAEAKKKQAEAKLDQHSQQTAKAKEIFDKFFTEVFYPKVEETAAYLKEKGHRVVVSDKHNVWGSDDHACSIYVVDKNRTHSKDDIQKHPQAFGFHVLFNSSNQRAEFVFRSPSRDFSSPNVPHENSFNKQILEVNEPFVDEILASFMKTFTESLR